MHAETFVVVLLAISSVWCKNELALKSILKQSTSRDTRPVNHASTVVQVVIDVALRSIVGLDLKNQVLKTNLWMRMYWDDENLRWDPEEFEGLEQVNFLPTDIWVPDVVLYNSASGDDSGLLNIAMKTFVIVNYRGRASWYCPLYLQSDCAVDISMFPFDHQTCELKFGLWTFDGFAVNLSTTSNRGDTSMTAPSGEWILEDMSADRREVMYVCCPAPYPFITFKINMQRRTKFYLFNLIVPGALIGLVACLTFLLPPQCGERIGLGITNLLAMMVFLLLVYDSIPATSDAVPIVGKIFMFILVMCALALLFTCFVLNISFMGGSRPEDVPYFVRVWINQYLAAVLFVAGEQRRFTKYFAAAYRRAMKVVGNRKQRRENGNPETFLMTEGPSHFEEENQSQLPAHNNNSLDMLCKKIQREELEKACQAEWETCVKVLDRFFLVTLIATMGGTMAYLLGQPEHLVVG